MKRINIEPSLAARHITPDANSHYIEYFGAWLTRMCPQYTVQPPVTVYDYIGNESLAFAVRLHGEIVGIFTSPLQVLFKIGDEELIGKFIHYMRTDGRAALREKH